MNETAVCAALNAALTGDGQATENRFLRETVGAACDALMGAARANGWTVADAARLSLADWLMMARTPLLRDRRSLP